MLTDHTHTIVHNPHANQYGIAVADVDGDGRPEWLVCGHGSPNRILKWKQNQLHDVLLPTFADADRNAISIAAGDIDGDGREEVYIVNAELFAGSKLHADRLIKFGTVACEDLFSKSENCKLRNIMSGRSVATLDRRGSGRYGFFVLNYQQPSRFYEMSTDGRLVELAGALNLNVVVGGRGLWVGPLVSDRCEILCVNDGGPNLLLQPSASLRFDEIAAEYHLNDEGENGRGVAVLDADGDGRLDVVWCNWQGPHRLMLRQNNGTFRDRASPALAMPSPARNVLAADFDNCGHEELFFHNHGEANRLFAFRGGAWRLEELGDALLPDGLGTGAAVADIDGDGRLELLLSHGESAAQPLRMFKFTGPQQNWIRIQPRTRFGAPARGAVVRLLAGGRQQIRVIDGGSGYLCQVEPTAHFGLGDVKEVEAVRVTWPDGASVTLHAPPIGRTHTLKYPQG